MMRGEYHWHAKEVNFLSGQQLGKGFLKLVGQQLGAGGSLL
jgi:hypothetical protein